VGQGHPCIQHRALREVSACGPWNFDGRTDSIYHPFDLDGNMHMEYLGYRGEFADVPIEAIMETFIREYRPDENWQQGDFDREVEQETGKD
jgi:hypothetical protein